ncbi:MAG: hypothetical protein AAFV45_14310 [Pseudomonadota bacterium]
MGREHAKRLEVLKPLDDVFRAETLKEAREKLGAVLFLSGPAPQSVTARVLADAKFAETLAAVRMFPDWRQKLLADPMNKAFEIPQDSTDHGSTNGSDGDDQLTVPSTIALVRKSSKALLRWGASGFKTAEPWVIEARTAACEACPNLVAAPDRVAYQMAKTLSSADNRVCKACGCIMAKKVMMPDEICPAVSDTNPKRSRWGDLIDAAETVS